MVPLNLKCLLNRKLKYPVIRSNSVYHRTPSLDVQYFVGLEIQHPSLTRFEIQQMSPFSSLKKYIFLHTFNIKYSSENRRPYHYICFIRPFYVKPLSSRKQLNLIKNVLSTQKSVLMNTIWQYIRSLVEDEPNSISHMRDLSILCFDRNTMSFGSQLHWNTTKTDVRLLLFSVDHKIRMLYLNYDTIHRLYK